MCIYICIYIYIYLFIYIYKYWSLGILVLWVLYVGHRSRISWESQNRAAPKIFAVFQTIIVATFFIFICLCWCLN